MNPVFRKTVLAVFGFVAGMLLSAQAQARYETCYEQEYRCNTRYEQECSYQPVCRYVPGQQHCRQEQICAPRPSQPNCQTVTECGTNAHGQQICKNRQVCNGHTGGGQDCRYVQKCEAGQPRQECHNEHSCRQVPRQHCGYETVAKQCWVPDPPPYQPPYQPPQPPYQPPYQPPHNPPVYPPVDPGQPDDDDEDDSTYIPEELGPQTVTGLKLKILADETAQVVFVDEGQETVYRTEYHLTVRDGSGRVVVEDRLVSNGRLSQKIILTQKLSLRQDHTLRLKVVRKGEDRKFTFVKKYFRPGPR